MRIMSLNAWGGKLFDDFCAFIRVDAPDLLCLQEVVRTPLASKEWLTYRDGSHVLPQRSNLFEDVCTILPDHVGFFCPAAQGSLWDGDEEIASQWGLATFVHKRLTIIGQVQGFVHKDYAPDGFGEHPRSRSAHGVRVFDGETGATVSVVHMHGLRDLEGKHDTPARREQVARFWSMVETLSSVGDKAVLCGDFNIEPESETLVFLKLRGFVELVERFGVSSTRTSHYKKPGKYADYMLVKDGMKVIDFAVLREPEVSDHCPLIVEI
jgi:endonuclease/exonuclease/phosphatase family metal-dependent hydrolase